MTQTFDFLTAEKEINQSKAHFHVMAKPIGPVCNLKCTYCYYLEKENIYEDKKSTPKHFKMPSAILERYIKEYISSQPIENPVVQFTWQGGEPTLLGIDYYEKAIELQEQYSDGRKIENTIQTNATLIDEEWAKFLAKHDFLVGVSIDGPEDLHDCYRVNKGEKGSWDRIMKSIELLKKYNVRFNTLTVVHSKNVKHPLRVYRFLKHIGSEWHQFLPVQDRHATDEKALLKQVADDYAGETQVTEESIKPEEWGNFLNKIFDEWVRQDVGKIFVQQFDIALEGWVGKNPSACVHAKTCGDGVALEHNGDVYTCDHYVYPQFKLGNIRDKSFTEMATSHVQRQFGNKKQDSLSSQCRNCDYLQVCNGLCPKHRWNKTKDGENIAYLCGGYKAFYKHITPYMHTMRELLKLRRAPAEIMELIKLREAELKREKKKLKKSI
ncbi:anaerobic sulfatase maturase [Sediminitomix flava]|uniref:Transcriptional regulator n=1 Tax=Sediminitomix flava TaxID=379075 RepID=A0A315ZBT6_SEDFL|nr:anaerobic sulfatase maturase [Sediminitomix flava]PWJ43035.1 transcriptional regulator [Sediminitomix flava]